MKTICDGCVIHLTSADLTAINGAEGAVVWTAVNITCCGCVKHKLLYILLKYKAQQNSLFVSVYPSRLGSTRQVLCKGWGTKWADTEWGHMIHGCSTNEHRHVKLGASYRLQLCRDLHVTYRADAVEAGIRSGHKHISVLIDITFMLTS